MNREILFKAKRIDNGEWVEGYYQVRKDVFENDEHLIFQCKNHYTWEYAKVDPETLCQCTGLTDKNGKKIWENDVVRCDMNLIITWEKELASFCVTGKRWLYKHFFGEAIAADDVEVIGNTFDNPELLER